MTLVLETGNVSVTLPFAPTPAERHEMVAVAAYFLAEQRSFAPGHADVDWINAERQIDHLLAAMQAAGRTRNDYTRVGLRNALLLWAN